MNQAAIRSLPERKTFTVAETAAIVGVGRSTLYEHVKLRARQARRHPVRPRWPARCHSS